MLDDRERQILRDMERELGADPGWSARFDRPGREDAVLGPPWWPLVAVVAGLVVAVLLMMLGLVGEAFLLLAVAAAPVAPRWWRALRRRQGDPGRAGPQDPSADR